MIAATWVVTVLAVVLWSITIWGLHALLRGPADWVPRLVGWLDALPGAGGLDAWMPGWREGLLAAAEWAQWVFGWLTGAAPLLIWVLWGLGVTALLTLALLVTLLLVLAAPSAAPPRTAR